MADVKVPELTNAKHAAQWGTTLATYTYPSLHCDKLGAFMKKLHAIQAANSRDRCSLSPSMALEFLILTNMRTNPIITAEWRRDQCSEAALDRVGRTHEG